MRLLSSFAAGALVILGASACARQHPAGMSKLRAEPNLITHDDIVRSGALNAFDAVRRAHTFLSISEDRGQYALAQGVRVTSRGRTSLVLNPQILLVVDNVPRLDVASLRDIPADNVAWIRVLTSMEATPIYGTDGGNGAIVVRTRIPE